jgi:DNA-binding GntR family transcriptional regulator
MILCRSEDRIRASARLHRHILRALRAGDLESAQALLRQHAHSMLEE